MSPPLPRSILLAAEAGKEAVLDLLLPPACRLCNQPVFSDKDFCRDCERALTVTEAMMKASCIHCGLPRPQVIPAGPAGQSEPDSAAGRPSCVQCRSFDFQFDVVIPLWAYQDRVCEAVVAAKYANGTPLGHALGRRLGEQVKNRLSDDAPDLVTFVPSHVTRQLSRGGNGNHVIATTVADVISRPCFPLLRTTRRIAKQAWLDDAERLENVRDAFSLKKSYAFARSPEIADRHILVIDDVLTTGATANEVARVLREGGARRVSLAVVARAVRLATA